MWSDLLKAIAEQADRDHRLPEPSPELLRQCWPTLIGASLARRSRPQRLDDGCLYIATDAQALAREWKQSPMPLIRRLRRFSPWPIDSLSITYVPSLGGRRRPVPPPRDDAPPPSPPPATPDGVDDELRSLIASIDRHRRHEED